MTIFPLYFDNLYLIEDSSLYWCKAFTGTALVGLGAAVGGILFAPFTGGASLIASYYGAAAAVGGATASTACLISHTCLAKTRQGMHFKGIYLILYIYLYL